MSDEPVATEGYARSQGVGLVLGVVAFVALLLAPAPEGLSAAGWRTTAVVALIAVWWVTEAIPLSATALLPLALFPLLDVMPIKETAFPYANPIIFLMLGGFIIALGMQRWGLHRRIALNLVALVGARPANVVGGFMLAAGLVSMWVFNTTTTVMMVPIALSVIEFVAQGAGDDPERRAMSARFATVLMIAIAYAATIGGMGTLIGTAPNAVLAGFMSETYGITVSFGEWMLVGVPTVAIMLPLTWLVLTRIAFPLRMPAVPGQAEMIADQLAALGPMSRGERTVAAIVAVTAFLWVFRPVVERVSGIDLNDTSIAFLGALAMFVVPVEPRKAVFVLSGEWAAKLPWGVVVLFGGGLSLAAGIKGSGLADWIGGEAGGLSDLPTLFVIFAVVVLMILLTELTSNTATTATFLPIVAAIAIGIGENPLLLVFPTVLAASCAFMMPVATPPNAVVFASGHIRIAQLIRGGVLANFIGLCVTMVITYTVVRLVFGIELGVVPDWANGTQ
ncbi:MAG TPA: DASS family sodium-coupled anion symporter [Alphaproteobacteria bacterium]|nr:DASS family sodium-coupled anion symporter [Alphaproteobacteria bacterium]